MIASLVREHSRQSTLQESKLPLEWTKPSASKSHLIKLFEIVRASAHRRQFIRKMYHTPCYYRCRANGLKTMPIKGCGKRGEAGLTFYPLHSAAASTQEKFERIACGQSAETTSGSRGVLLCENCAKVHGLRVFRKEHAVSGGAGL